MAEETNSEIQYSIRNIVFKEEIEDVPEDKIQKESSICNETELSNNFSFKHSIVFDEDSEDLPMTLYNNELSVMRAQDNMTNKQEIKTEKLYAQKIKEESSDEELMKHNLAIHQSIKNSIVYEEDLDDLYEDHIIKEELVIGPEVLQCAADIFTPGNIFQHNNNKVNKKSNHKKRNTSKKSKTWDTSIGLKRIPYDKQCTQCFKKFRLKESLEKHMEAHDNPCAVQKEHSCEICGKVYELKNSLKRHLKTHSDTALFKCNKCRNTYKTNEYLQYHYLSKHSYDDLEAQKYRIVCKYCSKIFTDKSNCNRHEKYQCPNNLNKMKKQKKIKNKQNVKTTTSIICDICQRTFSTKTCLNRHIKLHMGHAKKPLLECDLCSKKYTKKYSLRIHIVDKHLNIKDFFCGKCKQGFVRRWDLKQHEKKCEGTLKKKNKNLYERKFECDLCSNKYKGKNGLLMHIETKHLNIKRFSCDHCRNIFARKWLLKCHINKYHPQD